MASLAQRVECSLILSKILSLFSQDFEYIFKSNVFFIRYSRALKLSKLSRVIAGSIPLILNEFFCIVILSTKEFLNRLLVKFVKLIHETLPPP